MGIYSTRRGSALLMVVGLLTMIAMLGGTFLVVAHLDARQTESLMAKAQADPLAAGVASQLMAVMAADLNIGDDSKGPFSTTDAGNWTVYAMCPSDDVAHYKYIHVQDSATGIKHLSSLQGSSSNLVDTDGDGTADAYLIDTKIQNSRGETYYVAVNVVDLAGLLNVNVHSKLTPAMVPHSVSNVDLRSFISTTRFNALQTDRAGSDVDPVVWWVNAGRRIYNPASGRPFAIGDEMYLRWLGSPSVANTGRLYAALSQGANYADRAFLTTSSCSRDLLRRPAAGFLEKFVVSPTFLQDATALTVLNRLRAELAYAYGTGGGGGGGGGSGDTWEKTIDDGDATGFATNCTKYYTGYGYAGDFHWNEYPGNGIEQYWATWQVGSIPSGSTVDVTVYYCPHATRGTNIPVTVYDGTTSKGTKPIDQRQGPNLGIGEADLASYEINNGTIVVKMTDAHVADGLVCMDAVKFTVHEPAPPPPPSTSDKGPEIEHFLANLWASLSPYDTARTKTYEWAYDSTDATKKVYGLVSQPFLVEAYAQHHSDTDTDTDNTPDETWMYGYAIKLMNPTTRALDLSNIRIKGLTGTSTEKTLGSLIGDLGAGAGKLPANGGYVILYDSDSGTNYKNSAGVRDPLPDLKFKTGGNVTKWIQCEGLRFWGNTTIKIVRHIDPSTDIPLDSISCSELGYDASETEIKQTDDKEKRASARRDDNLTRGRYSVAVYKKSTENTASHALNNNSTGVGTSEIPTTKGTDDVWCPLGFHVDVPHAQNAAQFPTSPADFGLLLTAGPRNDKDLPHVLLDHRDSKLRAHVDFRTSCNANASQYPDVPWPTLLGELLRFPYRDSAGNPLPSPTDTERHDGPTASRHYRIYGQININTAPKRVIEKLPWKTTLTSHGVTVTTSAAEIASRVVNYRDRKGTYSSTRTNAAANLREKSKYTGFLTPGEIAVPLADLVEEKLQAASANTVTNREKAFFELLNGLYGSVANCIAVNSDVFAANICVQLVKGSAPAAGDRKWHYVAVVDRSACYKKADSPALLMFTQVR